MPTHDPQPNDETLVLQIDRKLKAAFQDATGAENKPVDVVLQDLMRAYVRQQRATQAQRQSRVIAERAADPGSDENEVMRWIEDVSDTDGWTA